MGQNRKKKKKQEEKSNGRQVKSDVCKIQQEKTEFGLKLKNILRDSQECVK